MRSLAALVLTCGLAHADASIDAPPRPHTPLGPRCDAALANALATWRAEYGGVHFAVRERSVTGRYDWSDMCGVYGIYSFALARDLRADEVWRSLKKPTVTEAEKSAIKRVTRRGHGWRATLETRSDSADDSHMARRFTELFQPALDVCLQ